MVTCFCEEGGVIVGWCDYLIVNRFASQKTMINPSSFLNKFMQFDNF